MAIKNPVLVTGGAGYIGTHVCHELSLRGYTPIVLDDLSTGSVHQLKRVTHLFSADVDVANANQVEDFFKYWTDAAGPFAAAVHLAAKTSVPEGEQNPHEYYRVNGLGTLNIARACNKYKVPVLIYSSTAAVYGITNDICKEWHETRPANVYGETKLLGEKFVSGYYSGRSLVFRFFNVAGASPEIGLGDTRPPAALIPSAVKAAYDGFPFSVYGDGQAVRDFVHVHDLARTIALSVDDPRARGVFNISSGKSHTVSDVVKRVQNINPSMTVSYAGSRSGDVLRSRASITKISQILGYHPTKTLCDMISSEYAWRHIISSRCV